MHPLVNKNEIEGEKPTNVYIYIDTCKLLNRTTRKDIILSDLMTVIMHKIHIYSQSLFPVITHRDYQASFLKFLAFFAGPFLAGGVGSASEDAALARGGGLGVVLFVAGAFFGAGRDPEVVGACLTSIVVISTSGPTLLFLKHTV